MKRRFSFYYDISGYDWKELTQILIFKVDRLRRWNLTQSAEKFLLGEKFLESRVSHFPHFAGDIETLLLNVKISHCKRVFGKGIALQRQIEKEDLQEGFTRFIRQKEEDVERRKREAERIALLYS